jgi:hypothetical protein
MLKLSLKTDFEYDCLSDRTAGRGRRCGLLPFSPGTQFSLSESPDGDLVKEFSPLLDRTCFDNGTPIFCNLARLDMALPSFGFFPRVLDSGLADGALRLLLFDFKAVLLVERMRLIAATADPLDSFSACVVSSS